MALIPTTPAPVDYRRKIAMELMQQGMDGAPVRHWAQGLAKLGQGALGGYEMYQADQKDKADDLEGAKAYMALLQNTPGATPTPAAAAPAPTPAPVPPASPAVPMAAPMGNKVVDALAPPPVTGPRPNGPVMPSAKVWGDKEAEDAGLYPPSAPNTKLASVDPAAIPAAAPAQPAPSPVTQALAQAPQAAPAPQAVAQAEDPNRAKIIQLLSSDSPAARKMGKALADNYIASQFKPQDYDIHHRADGSIVAVNKKNPNDVRTMSGDSQGLVKFEADKAGAVERAKREGAIDFEAGKAGAVKRSELEAARAVAKPEQDKQDQKVASVVTQDIDRALGTIKNSTLATTGATGNLLSHVGGTAAHDLSKLLDTVKSNAGFQELSKMRQASPTGAALGSVTERELALLQSTIGNLEQSQSREQLEDNLRRVKNTYLDIIHGDGKGPAREKLGFQEKPKAVDPGALEEARRRGLIK